MTSKNRKPAVDAYELSYARRVFVISNALALGIALVVMLVYSIKAGNGGFLNALWFCWQEPLFMWAIYIRKLKKTVYNVAIPRRCRALKTDTQKGNRCMECFRCREERENSTTTFYSNHGDRIIIIKHVPCLKCKMCGDAAYIGTVIKRLEDITKQFEDLSVEIAVVDYAAA